MNFITIAIGSAGFLALITIALLLKKRLGFKPIWTSASDKQKAADNKRRDQILRG